MTFGQVQTPDTRQKATHMSPPCKFHRWAQKKMFFSALRLSYPGSMFIHADRSTRPPTDAYGKAALPPPPWISLHANFMGTWFIFHRQFATIKRPFRLHPATILFREAICSTNPHCCMFQTILQLLCVDEYCKRDEWGSEVGVILCLWSWEFEASRKYIFGMLKELCTKSC